MSNWCAISVRFSVQLRQFVCVCSKANSELLAVRVGCPCLTRLRQSFAGTPHDCPCPHHKHQLIGSGGHRLIVSRQGVSASDRKGHNGLPV